MKHALLLGFLAYLLAAYLDGIRGVLTLMAVGVVGTAVIFTADALHRWRADRAERAAVYRRFRAGRRP